MTMQRGRDFDLICLGSGPAGQKAAIQAAKAGFRAAIVEREAQIGGSCLLSGTIPSKALREQALRYLRARAQSTSIEVQLHGDAPLSALLKGVDEVIASQDRYMQLQMERNRIELVRGKGVLLDANRVAVRHLDGAQSILRAPRILLATGSRPRHVSNIEVDHEHVVDSDSVLSLSYLPRSLVVLGSGVIACEYASIFASLGCEVTHAGQGARAPGVPGSLAPRRLRPSLPRHGRPLSRRSGGRRRLLRRILAGGGRDQGRRVVDDGHRVRRLRPRRESRWNRPGRPRSRGQRAWARAGERAVRDQHPGDIRGGRCDRTSGARLRRRRSGPARRARRVRAAAAPGHEPGAHRRVHHPGNRLRRPVARRGGREKNRRRSSDAPTSGEVARAHIAGSPNGFLTLVCERASSRVLGVQVLGEGATELVHLGQGAIASGATADFFIEQIFNFPTTVRSLPDRRIPGHEAASRGAARSRAPRAQIACAAV